MKKPKLNSMNDKNEEISVVTKDSTDSNENDALEVKINIIKRGFESINHTTLTDEYMHSLSNYELKKYFRAGKNEEPSVIKRLIDALVCLFAVIVVIFYVVTFLGGIFNVFNPDSKTQDQATDEYYQNLDELRGP